MFYASFFHTFWIFCCFSLFSLILGRRLLRFCSFSLPISYRLALGYVLGFGVILYSALILGLFGRFHALNFVFVFAVFGAFLAKDFPAVFRDLRDFFVVLGKFFRTAPLNGLFLGGVLLFAALNFLAAFAPPTARDAISYHIPEAQIIVGSGRITFPLGDHQFYGNLPVLFEVGYALGMLFSGYALAQLFHYAFFLAFVVFVFGFMKRHFGFRAAGVASLLLFFLHDLVTTAISLNIDTAHIVLEVMGFLLALDFIASKQRAFLTFSGAVFGLALSIKYSPLVSAGLVGGLVFVASWRERKSFWRNIWAFFLPLVLTAGFWYGKNLILLGNPFYPLYFGHRGYDEVAFASLIQAIQDFRVPRTLLNFILLPKIFYWRYPPFFGLFDIPQATLVFFSFCLFPFVLLVRRKRALVLVMFGFVVVYAAYWFFAATHQIRFLDVANIVLILLVSIVVSSVPWRKFSALLFLSVFLSGLFLFRAGIVKETVNRIVVGVGRSVGHVREVEYTLGILNKAEYLDTYLDCGLDAAYFLEERHLSGAVLDNWSVWHNHHFRFYVTQNVYVSLPENLSLDALTAFVQSNNVRYVYINEEAKHDFASVSDPIPKAYWEARRAQEEVLLQQAQLLYTKETCSLYAIR